MEEIKLSVEKQGRLKTISKIISICSIIARVFCIIGVIGIVLSMVLVPVVTCNIKINLSNNTIKFFGENVTFERADDRITFTGKDDSTTIDDKDAVYALNKIFDYLDKIDLPFITFLVEVVCIFAIAIIVLTFMILGKVTKLFNNIHDKDTPFTIENVGYIRNIAILLIIMACVKIVCGGFVSLLVANSSIISFELMDVILILTLFVVSYIFEYGCSLQAKSECKIYD